LSRKSFCRTTRNNRGKLAVKDILLYRDILLRVYREFAVTLPRPKKHFTANQETFYYDIATCLPQIFKLLLPGFLPGILPRHSGLILPLNIYVFVASITATITTTLPRQFQDVCRTNCHDIAACFLIVFHNFAASLHYSYRDLAAN
jgi:hypothetical protein